MDKGSLEVLLGRGLSVEEIAKRFGRHPSTVSYWMDKHGLTAVHKDKHSSKGGIDRAQLEALVEAGMTIAEIAAVVGRSKTTVRYWLRRYELKTHNTVGRRPADESARAKDAGLIATTMICRRHGESEFCLEGRGYSNAVAQSRSRGTGAGSRRCSSRRPAAGAQFAATTDAWPRSSSTIWTPPGSV